MLLTFRDAIDNLVDYNGGDVQDSELRILRRAVRQAYNMFYQVVPWLYFQSMTNIGLSNNTLATQMKFTESTKILSREFTVVSAIPGAPIRIIVDSQGALQDNETITITGATGDTSMNGTWVVDKISANEFDLIGSISAGVYDPSSGKFNRGVFPDWAGDATVKIGQSYFQTVEKIDSYNLLMHPLHYPRQDDYGNWSMSIRHYDLPADFLKMGTVVDGQNNHFSDCYVTPSVWLMAEQGRYYSNTLPFQWTILPHPTLRQRFRLHFNGVPSSDRNVSFIYQRRLNDMFRWAGVESEASSAADEAIAVNVTNGDTLVFGSNTAFRNSMAGSVLRIGVAQVPTDPAEPTSLDGNNPFEEEHVIESVQSTTQLTLETPITGPTATTLQFMITDLIDVAVEHQVAFYRACELCYNILSRDESKLSAADAAYRAAIVLAMESEHKVSFYGNAMPGASALGNGNRDPYNMDMGTYVSI